MTANDTTPSKGQESIEELREIIEDGDLGSARLRGDSVEADGSIETAGMTGDVEISLNGYDYDDRDGEIELCIEIGRTEIFVGLSTDRARDFGGELIELANDVDGHRFE